MNANRQDRPTVKHEAPAPACCESVLLSSCCGSEVKADCCGAQQVPTTCGCTDGAKPAQAHSTGR